MLRTNTVKPEVEQQHLYPPGWVSVARLTGVVLTMFLWPYTFCPRIITSLYLQGADTAL